MHGQYFHPIILIMLLRNSFCDGQYCYRGDAWCTIGYFSATAGLLDTVLYCMHNCTCMWGL